MIPVNELARGYRLYQEEYEQKALKVLRSGWYVLGKEVEQFELEYANALGEGVYCAGVDNGLNAIRLGLHACGIGAGDEVIVQANGYIATMLGITQNGGTPVFVEPDIYHNMDPDKIEAAVTEKTKAVLVTHLYGQATRMDKVMDICKKYGLMLFEDCAQSHFSTYQGTCTGLFGDAGFFSFYPTKNLGCFGDGGGIVSRNRELIEKIRVLRNYGSDVKYHNIVPGFNARLDELQAGLLRVKLSHMPELLANRRRIARAYLSGIHNPLVELPLLADDVVPVWYLFVVRVSDQTGFRKFLHAHGVATDVHFPTPPHLQPALAYLGHGAGAFPIAEKDCGMIVSLPMMDDMSEQETETVIRVVNAYEG